VFDKPSFRSVRSEIFVDPVLKSQLSSFRSEMGIMIAIPLLRELERMPPRESINIAPPRGEDNRDKYNMCVFSKSVL
jgi:hypothetical protein